MPKPRVASSSVLLVATALIASTAFLTSCERSDPSQPRPSTTNPTAPSATGPAVSPRHPARLFVNNHVFGPTNGCRTTLVSSTGEMTCGHDQISTVGWELLEAGPNGDRWSFVRSIEQDGESSGTESKVIVFDGSEPIILFEDEHQRILLHPDQDES